MRIISYNLLVPNYANALTYAAANGNDLLPAQRLFQILAKIGAKIAESRGENPPIFALQEVSLDWHGKLAAFFEGHGYSFYCHNYGDFSGDFMGVGIAIPREKFVIHHVEMKVVSDTWKWMKPPAATQPQNVAVRLFQAVFGGVTSLFAGLTSLFNTGNNNNNNNNNASSYWDIAKWKKNAMVAAVLSPRNEGLDDGKNKFLVANYHMPCDFTRPQVMMLHVSMISQYVQKLASQWGHSEGEGKDKTPIPYALCGDFNIKPQDHAYSLLTNGTFDGIDQEMHPLQRPYDYHRLTFDPQRSALKVKLGKEPDYTNNVITSVNRDGKEPFDEFKDTLDYIFLSRHWKVEDAGVENLGNVNEPQPNSKEPSDHLLIHATVSL